MSDDSTAPVANLSGIRVLDLTQYLSGPACTLLMAGLGADVVKIEPAPGGDAARRLPIVDGVRSSYYVQQNRGKRSVCVDLDQPAGPRKAATTPTRADDAGPSMVDRLAAEARATAEAEAAAVVGTRLETDDGPKLSKADRERIRRAGRRTITAELTAGQGAMLDVLAQRYGSQRAALGEAIRRLYNAEEVAADDGDPVGPIEEQFRSTQRGLVADVGPQCHRVATQPLKPHVHRPGGNLDHRDNHCFAKAGTETKSA